MILQRPILSNNFSIESVFFASSNIQDIPTLWSLCCIISPNKGLFACSTYARTNLSYKEAFIWARLDERKQPSALRNARKLKYIPESFHMGGRIRPSKCEFLI